MTLGQPPNHFGISKEGFEIPSGGGEFQEVVSVVLLYGLEIRFQIPHFLLQSGLLRRGDSVDLT